MNKQNILTWIGAALLAAGGALAAEAQPANSVSVELNKLESFDKGCRAYIVVNNPGDDGYQSFKLDLVLFQSDGVIGRRFAMDLGPLKPSKRTVKLFDLDGIGCEKIGSFLVNDVMECKADTGPLQDCLGRLTVNSLTSVQLNK